MNQTGDERKTRSALRTNLPAVLTSFIGREREIREVTRLLASSRLVTLTGPAGGGKTRLALRVAAEVGRHYRDGAHWIELARLADAALIPLTRCIPQPNLLLLQQTNGDWLRGRGSDDDVKRRK